MVAEKAEINVGDRVRHPKLGEGEVLDVHPFGEERRESSSGTRTWRLSLRPGERPRPRKNSLEVTTA
jgi:hypothetical protein